jgi:hypothetical protein
VGPRLRQSLLSKPGPDRHHVGHPLRQLSLRILVGQVRPKKSPDLRRGPPSDLRHRSGVVAMVRLVPGDAAGGGARHWGQHGHEFRSSHGDYRSVYLRHLIIIPTLFWIKTLQI